jgi:hypothetical protein
MQANDIVIKTARIKVQSRLFVLEKKNDLSRNVRYQSLLDLHGIPFSNIEENKVCVLQFLNAFASQPPDRPDQYFSSAPYTFRGAFFEKAEQMDISWCSDFEDLYSYGVMVGRVMFRCYSSWAMSPCERNFNMYRGTLSTRMVS